MEVPVGTRPSHWRSEATKRLHNQVGHAFRVAKKHVGHAPCWRNGIHLARHVAQWVKILDGQIAVSMHVAPDLSEYKPRQLVPHVSEVTAVPTDDDVLSCATTEAWESQLRSSRKPRRRPGRRARRHARLLEWKQITSSLAKSVDNELKWETGQGSLAGITELAACLERDEEDADDDSQFCWDDISRLYRGPAAQGAARMEIATSTSTSTSRQYGQFEGDSAAHSHVNTLVAKYSGIKRKLADVDDLGDEASLSKSHDGTRYEKSKQFSSAGEARTCSLEEFWDGIRSRLSELLSILSSPPPTCAEEVIGFQSKVRDSHGEITSFLLEPPLTGHQSVRNALDLLREQVVDRDSPRFAAFMLERGLLKWFEEVDTCLMDFDNYDDEDFVFFWKDFAEEMQNQYSIVEYCLTQLEDIITGEE